MKRRIPCMRLRATIDAFPQAPEERPTRKRRRGRSSARSKPSVACLCALPNDVLIHIVALLPPHDQRAVSATCNRLCDAVRAVHDPARDAARCVIDTFPGAHLEDWPPCPEPDGSPAFTLLRPCGSHVHTIRLNVHWQRTSVTSLLSRIVLFCPALRHLSLGCGECVTPNVLYAFAARLPLLDTLELAEPRQDAFMQLPTMKNLRFLGIYEICPDWLPKIAKLLTCCGSNLPALATLSVHLRVCPVKRDASNGNISRKGAAMIYDFLGMRRTSSVAHLQQLEQLRFTLASDHQHDDSPFVTSLVQHVRDMWSRVPDKLRLVLRQLCNEEVVYPSLLDEPESMYVTRVSIANVFDVLRKGEETLDAHFGYLVKEVVVGTGLRDDDFALTDAQKGELVGWAKSLNGFEGVRIVETVTVQHDYVYEVLTLLAQNVPTLFTLRVRFDAIVNMRATEPRRSFLRSLARVDVVHVSVDPGRPMVGVPHAWLGRGMRKLFTNIPWFLDQLEAHAPNLAVVFVGGVLPMGVSDKEYWAEATAKVLAAVDRFECERPRVNVCTLRNWLDRFEECVQDET